MKKFVSVLFILLFTFASVGDVFASGTWTEQTDAGSRNWQSITSSADGTKLAATVTGTSGNRYIYTSTDSGETWIARTSAGSRHWGEIVSSSDGTKLAAIVEWRDDDSSSGISGFIYTSSDSGETWVERTSAGQRPWHSITSSADGTKLAAVDGGTHNSTGRIYTSTDSGETWTAQTNAGSRYWGSITSSSDGTKLAAVERGHNRYIYTSTDSGVTWTAQTNAGSRNWRSITSSADGTKLAAVVSNGHIYTSTDSGETWTEQTNAGSRNWRSIISSADGTKLAAGATFTHIYTSIDSGVTWTEETDAGSRAWGSITSSSDGTKLAAVVSNGHIYTAEFDYTPPTILSVSSDKPDGHYTVGEIIDIMVTFSEPVTSTGNVTVTLETGDINRTCTFAVSNSDTGSCNYTVQEGDTSADLTVASISGTIADEAGNALVDFIPATNLATNKNIVIDTTPPTISITEPTNNTTVSGGAVTLSVDVADPNLVGVQFIRDTDIHIGDEITSEPFSITWDTTELPDGEQIIIAVARDIAGNYATSTSVVVNINNTPPDCCFK